MSKKSDAVKKAVAAAKKATDAATKAAEAKTEEDRVRAAAEAHENALLAMEHAEEVERQQQFEIEEGERLAREENATGFWQKFKTAVGW